MDLALVSPDEVAGVDFDEFDGDAGGDFTAGGDAFEAPEGRGSDESEASDSGDALDEGGDEKDTPDSSDSFGDGTDGLGESSGFAAPTETPDTGSTLSSRGPASGGTAPAPAPAPAAPTTEASVAPTATDEPTVAKVSRGRDELIRGGKEDDPDLTGGEGVDDIRGKKGDDDLDGAGGDDWLRGGHGDDELDGGSGSDLVDGDKGDDRLIYTLADNTGAIDKYDGGKGVDTLQINLTAAEFLDLQDELIELRDWIAENSDPKSSTGAGFSDASAASGKHPVYETSFGLTIRNFEDLSVHVEGYGEVEVDQPLPEGEETPSEPETPPPAEETPPPAEETPPPAEEAPPPVEDVFIDMTAASEDAVSVSLRPGSTVNVSVEVGVTELPPMFDVFLVQDLSGSFWDDLPNVQAKFSSLYDGLTEGRDVQFGVGSFVDKPIEPFGYEPSGDYVYNTDLTVTVDKEAIQASLDALRTYSGYDYQESQLEALVQVALRGAEIGFRDGAQKFVVLSTDAAFHQEGDYAEAGPNDLDTEIEDEDYPNVAAVGELLKAAGITPIFAVTDYAFAEYQALVDAWGFGTVTLLDSDSANIVTAVTDGLVAATTDLSLDIGSDDYGFVSSVTPSVYEDAGPGTYTFDLTLEIPEDSTSYSSDGLTITIDGYGEVALDISIDRVDASGDDGADTMTGDAGPNALFGLGGDDVLDGAGGDDLLEGGTGSDTLTGGLGDDVFVFGTGDGTDTVTDFDAGSGSGDVIDLRRVTTVSTYTEVLAAAEQVGTDTVLDFGGGDTLMLMSVDLAALEADDFII